MTPDPLYAFYLRWADCLPLARAEDFRAELALLITSERARERRRLCTSTTLYLEACMETYREIDLQKGVTP